MEEVWNHGHEAGLGQLIGHLSVKIVQPAYVKGNYHCWMRSISRWQRGVHVHFAAANGQLICKTRHDKSPLKMSNHLDLRILPESNAVGPFR